MNLRRTIAVILGATLALCAVGGCVTERTSPSASSKNSIVRRPPPVSVSKTDPSALPPGPIAAPALSARTINARSLVGIHPIGTVPYDGMVLPIVSPDGTRLVTQIGDPPSWPTLLGAIGAPPSPRTRIEVYDITQSPPRPIRTKDGLPTGVVLGRSADAQGFLIEAPQPDGSRRIARVAWNSGEVQWLTDTGEVNAFGALDDKGRLLASRRGPSEAQFKLSVAGVPLDLTPGASALFPSFDSSTGLYTIFVEGPMGLEIQARSGAGLVGNAGADNLQLIARRTLAEDAGAPTAYQAAEPMRTSLLNYSGFGESPGVLMFYPGARRMAILDPDSAELVPLAKNSIAGCWAPDAGGWAVLLTTPDGLVHQRLKRDPSTGLWEAMPVARILGEAWVARATTSVDEPFILIGPAKDRNRRLSIASLRFADESEDQLGR